MAGEIDSDSETEYEIKKLSAGEDLVIDGETAVDDLLVAQRIAEREAELAAEIRDPGSSTGEAKPSKSDVKNLMTLLRQANELSQRICSLPEEFDGIMGNGVRSACKAAVEAMEKKLPEAEPSEGEDEEEDNGRKNGGRASASAASQAKALEGLDLDSTDEEEDGTKEQTGEPTAAPIDEPDGDEAEEDEVAEDLDDEEEEENELSKVIARAGFTEIAEDSDNSEEEKESRTDIEKLTIKTKGIVETIPLESEIDVIGEISSVVNDLVVVSSPEGSKALDLQSVVCLSNRDVIGVVVDTFGPVVQPFYLVYPTSKQNFSSMVGDQVFAAVGLDETSYLCDSASPYDLEAVRRNLLGDIEDDGDDGDEGDEGEDDEGEEGEEEPTKEELDRKALDDIGPEGMLGRGGSKSKRKGKGKGKGGKGKGLKGSKNSRAEANDFPKDEGVWGEPGQKKDYGVEDVKEETDERMQYLSTRKPTRWKLWRGKRHAGAPSSPVPAPPPPPKDPRASSVPPVPAPPPPAPPSSRQQQSARGRNDERAERHNPPPPPSTSRGWTPSESSTRYPEERSLRRQHSGHPSSDDRPFKQSRSSNGSAGASSALPPPPPPASSQRAAGRQRGSSSNGRSMAEETDAPWRRKG